ncbi:hypothetical protein [Inquilinus sp. OTU3971]|uniref:hypothetical protein n=1 Tax=Inquilinus sp. OTU3971 TaxID=3043855 RepID=UPI00313ECDF4
MLHPLDFPRSHRLTQASQRDNRLGNGFDTAVDRLRQTGVPGQTSAPEEDEATPGGVVVRRIRFGDTAIEIGEEHDYTVAQLQLMNPALRDNPNVLVEGDMLTILDQALFESVQAAVRITDEAVTAQASYDAMTRDLAAVPANLRNLYAAEAPSVRQTAEERRGEAAALLAPGLLEAGLASALDEDGLTDALDSHVDAIMPVGDGHSGFAAIVNQARSDARAQIDDIFGREVTFEDQATGEERAASLRDLVAAAEGTPTTTRRQDGSTEWANVRQGMVALMDELSDEAVEANGGNGANDNLIRTEAVRNVAQILAAATPNRDLAFDSDPLVSMVNGAADEILVLRSVQAVNDAAEDMDAALDAPDTLPALTTLVEQTEGIDIGLAAQRVQGSQSAVEGALFDLFRQQVDLGRAADMADDPRVRNAMTDLTLLADRMHTAEGQDAVRDLAATLVRVIELTGSQSRQSSESVALQIGAGLREAISDGHSPALAQEVARQLMAGEDGAPRYEAEASIILEQAGMGVERLQENAASTGQEFYDDVVYPAELGRQNFEGSTTFSHEDGVAALLESEQDLVEQTDRYGEAVVLTLAATQKLPPELEGLDGAHRLQDARSALETEVNQDVVTGEGEEAEVNAIPLLTQYSPSAALASQRVAADQAAARMRDVPAEDLDRLVEELGRLPADDPYAQMASELESLEDPRAVLYESPELTLALLDRFSEPDPAEPDVRPAPNAGFLSRAGRDILLEVFSFQSQAGGGMLPGMTPIQPTMNTRLDALQARLDAQRRMAALYNPQNAARSGFSALTGTAQRLWLQANPIQDIEARTGFAARAPAIPFVSIGSAALNAWGATFLEAPRVMDRLWGGYFAAATAWDLTQAVGGARAWATGRANFSQISRLRGWGWLPRIFGGATAALSVAYTFDELRRGDLPMAAAWVPGTAASIYALAPGATAAGPAVAVGFLLTAGLVTGINQYRHVQDANRLEGPLATYLRGAAPNVDKPESLANCDENGVPYLALNPEIARAQGVEPHEMVDYLYSLDEGELLGERDMLIDYALQVKPNDGEFPVRSEPGEEAPDTVELHTTPDGERVPVLGPSRNRIETIEDFQRWAQGAGYALPTGS